MTGSSKLIADAIDSRDKQVEEALSRFKLVDSESADLLQGLIDELTEFRRTGSFIDPDIVEMLNLAAYNLRGLNEENASLLYHAADRLERFDPETAGELLSASYKLADLDIVTLATLSENLRRYLNNM